MANNRMSIISVIQQKYVNKMDEYDRNNMNRNGEYYHQKQQGIIGKLLNTKTMIRNKTNVI